MKKLPIHLPLFIWGSVIIFVSGLIAAYLLLYPPPFFSPLIQALESRLGFEKIKGADSTVDISASGGNLRLQFMIAGEDQIAAAKFSEILGISNDWQKGIEVGIDPKSMQKFEGMLPLKANLKFEGKRVLITSKSFNLLQSALPKSGTHFATGSAQLDFTGEGDSYQVRMVNPGEILSYATASGTLTLSKKMSGMFSIADKVGTIELKLMGKSLDGEIVLK